MLTVTHITYSNGAQDVLFGDVDISLPRRAQVRVYQVDPRLENSLKSVLAPLDDPGRVTAVLANTGCPVTRFVKQHVTYPSEAEAICSEVYNAFTAFCAANELPAMTQNAFSRKFKKLTKSTSKSKSIDGKTYRVFTRISLL